MSGFETLSRARGGLGARLRAALLIGAGALVLAACNGSGPGVGSKALRPLSPETVALIEKKGMGTTSPISVRIFKEESELEVWKQTRDGDYALLKTYPICRWSGELGPKKTEGDRQAPEGFYTITPGQMNPNSSYYLAFNMGYPNAYDKAWGRTGAHLMVHGDCSSSGCYAMTDEQIQEIFALGRDSFTGGQRSFQVEAYPFRMTPANMARHRNNPNMPFWRMIKEGYDTLEITKAPPKVDVCGKRYVFNATPVDPAARFDPTAPCPEFTQPEELEQRIAAKRSQDEARIASLTQQTPPAPSRTGRDGGMNKVFLARLENPQLKTPGSLPPVVKPPGFDYGVDTTVPNDVGLGSVPSAEASVALAGGARNVASAAVPLPPARPADAPKGERGPETVLFANNGSTAPTARIASLDSASGGSFLSKLFGSSDEPSTTASTSGGPSASSGFSFSKLFGGKDEPAPTSTTASAPQAGVPVPPARP